MTELNLDELKKIAERKNRYEYQIKRLASAKKQTSCIEEAVTKAAENIRSGKKSFVIYGEPQSGKTEMMICLTGMLIDEGYSFVLHLLNDSVDLLDQNLGRFKESGLAPAARNFSEILDPAVKINGGQHVIFVTAHPFCTQ